jgi:FkbM family methyltransferase
MQVAREFKKLLLTAIPAAAREHILRTKPNWRKAAPARAEFQFDGYLGDVKVNIDTRYKVERIMWTGSYEPKLQTWVSRRLSAGDTVLDVGANVGAITLGLARAVGAGGRVIAIEPGPPNLARLKRNLALNPTLAAQTTVLGVGVSDAPGELAWAEEAANPGNAMLEQSPLFAQTMVNKVRVPIMTLDAIAREAQLTRVDFIKIDVEGMELQVLRGAGEVLEKFRPSLFLETLARYSTPDGGGALGEIERLLTPLGYKYFRVDAAGEAHGFSPPNWPDYTLAQVPQRT